MILSHPDVGLGIQVAAQMHIVILNTISFKTQVNGFFTITMVPTKVKQIAMLGDNRVIVGAGFLILSLHSTMVWKFYIFVWTGFLKVFNTISIYNNFFISYFSTLGTKVSFSGDESKYIYIWINHWNKLNDSCRGNEVLY